MAAALAAAATVGSARAEAAGAWIAGPNVTPIEQRIAIAAGPARTTVWTSVRFEGPGGAAALVVPAPAGATLDLSSDAWLEALDEATAPRVLPPPGIAAACVGAPQPADPFEIVGHIEPTPSTAITEMAVLPDAPAVSAWAAASGLPVAPALAAKLSASGAARFLALRLDLPAGASVTPTVRLVLPGAAPQLPLGLARAGAEDLAVSAWILGPGRASLAGAVEVEVAPLTWRQASARSDYADRRDDALAADPARFLVEAAGHDPIASPAPIPGAASSIDAAVAAYFSRAAASGDVTLDPAACTASVTAALASALTVAPSCPRGDIDPAPPCLESPAPDGLSPQDLRCGPIADDLAVALSGLSPAETWITRLAIQIPANTDGLPFAVDLDNGTLRSPLVTSAHVDTQGCPFPGKGSGWSEDGWDDSGYSNSGYPGGGYSEGGYSEGGYSEGGYDEGDGASSGGESCSCDAEDAAAGFELCAVVLEGLGEASDGCSVTGPRRARTPRFSLLLFAALVVLVPLRRRLRPRR